VACVVHFRTITGDKEMKYIALKNKLAQLTSDNRSFAAQCAVLGEMVGKLTIDLSDAESRLEEGLNKNVGQNIRINELNRNGTAMGLALTEMTARKDAAQDDAIALQKQVKGALKSRDVALEKADASSVQHECAMKSLDASQIAVTEAHAKIERLQQALVRANEMTEVRHTKPGGGVFFTPLEPSPTGLEQRVEGLAAGVDELHREIREMRGVNKRRVTDAKAELSREIMLIDTRYTQLAAAQAEDMRAIGAKLDAIDSGAALRFGKVDKQFNAIGQRLSKAATARAELRKAVVHLKNECLKLDSNIANTARFASEQGGEDRFLAEMLEMMRKAGGRSNKA